jgi:hypothetical protein
LGEKPFIHGQARGILPFGVNKFKDNISVKELKQKLNEKYDSLNLRRSNKTIEAGMIYKEDETFKKQTIPSQEKLKQSKFIIPNPIRIFCAWYKSYNINPAITAAWVGALIYGIFQLWSAHIQASPSSKGETTFKETTQNLTAGGDIVGRDKITIQSAPEVQDRQAQIKVDKVKINRILEDVSVSLDEIRNTYPVNSGRLASDFNTRNMLESGLFIQAQSELAGNEKEKIEKLLKKAHRDIEDIILDHFKTVNLSEISELSLQNETFKGLENKASDIKNGIDKVTEDWINKIFPFETKKSMPLN